MRKWHYSNGGADYGPVNEADIVQKIQSAELPPGTPVCLQGETEWKPARDHTCFQVEIFPRKKHSASNFSDKNSSAINPDLDQVLVGSPSPKAKKTAAPDLSISPELEAELIKLADNLPSSPPVITSKQTVSASQPALQGPPASSQSQSSVVIPPVISAPQSYAEVPWHRKHNLLVRLAAIGLLCFGPALWGVTIIALTGEVYYDEYESPNKLKTWSTGSKVACVVLSIISFIWFVAVLSEGF